MKKLSLIFLLGLFSYNCTGQIRCTRIEKAKEKRYFIVGYAFNFEGGNGQGRNFIECNGFPREKDVQAEMKKQVEKMQSVKLKSISIISFCELKEQDYYDYLKQD